MLLVMAQFQRRLYEEAKDGKAEQVRILRRELALELFDLDGSGEQKARMAAFEELLQLRGDEVWIVFNRVAQSQKGGGATAASIIHKRPEYFQVRTGGSATPLSEHSDQSADVARLEEMTQAMEQRLAFNEAKKTSEDALPATRSITRSERSSPREKSGAKEEREVSVLRLRECERNPENEREKVERAERELKFWQQRVKDEVSQSHEPRLAPAADAVSTKAPGKTSGNGAARDQGSGVKNMLEDATSLGAVINADLMADILKKQTARLEMIAKHKNSNSYIILSRR